MWPTDDAGSTAKMQAQSLTVEDHTPSVRRTLSARGRCDVLVQCTPGQAMSLVHDIPGVLYGDGGVLTTWDTVPLICERTGKDVPELPFTPLEQMPGVERYRSLVAQLDEPPRPYQEEDAVWLANRPYGFLCNPMRSGKSLTALLGAILAGHERILVLCPAISRFVWGDEVYKWLKEEALILSGLSLSRALQYCGTCKLSGRLSDGSRCPQCKQRNGSTYGYRIHEVRHTEPPTVAQQKTGAILWRCRKHPDITSRVDSPERCAKCRNELRHALQTVKVVVANYDILSAKGYTDKRGRVEKRDDLPGWEQALSLLDFDLAIVDESHTLRAFDTTEKKRGKMLYDRVRNIVAEVSNVWMVTGTPIFGMVRDLYGQLDVATNGLVGDGRTWTERYCAGHQGPYGWDATGRSNEEELQARLKPILVSRARSEILQYMPPKLRRVVHIDNDKPVRRKSTGAPASTVAKLIDAVAPLKHEVIIDNVLAEMNEGLKTYILTFRPKHAERIANLLTKRMNSRNWRQQMNKNKAEVFVGQTARGIDPKRRRELAKAFCAHEGAGAFIATIRSMPGSVSLKGVSTVHMADFDTSPSSMDQAEDRGYEPGISGYSITHYVVKNSIDDDLAQVVLPKFRTKDRMLQDENAQNVLAAFGAEDETCEEVMARHTAHLRAASDDDDWM